MTPSDLKSMSGAAILAHARDELMAEADRVLGLEQGLVRAGIANTLNPARIAVHDALCAASAALDRLIVESRSDSRMGKLIADVARSALITEAMRREGAPAEVARG